MMRLEALEKVLIAAEAVLSAREDQMLTRVEWDAMAAAVANARPEEPVSRNDVPESSAKIPVQILIEDGMRLVWDEDGDGIGCHKLGAPSLAGMEAERQIDRWAEIYYFDVTDVKRALDDYLREG